MAAKRPFFHSAAIYQFGDRILIRPYARTRDGVGVGMDVLATALPDNPSDIGVKLLAMMKEYKDNIPDDYSRKMPTNEVILREAEVKTWSAFHKKAQLVSVFREINAPQIELTPNRHVGRWSEGIDEKVRTCTTEPEEIGIAVLAALSDAE
jgi:SRSO17 transposase